MPARVLLVAVLLVLSSTALASTVATTSFPSERIQKCPAHHTSAVGADDLSACMCVAGYTASGSVCEPCPADHHKDSHGSAACTPCPLNTKSLPGAVNAAECLCAEGYYLATDQCTACPRNTYKTHVGAAACAACPEGTFHHATATLGETLATSCKCNRGSAGPAAGPCVQCIAGKYRNIQDAVVCEDCHEFSTSDPGTWNQDGCKCMAGYTLAGTYACEACAAGFFKDEVSNGVCSPCPDNSVTTPKNPNPTVIQLPATNRTQCVCGSSFSGEPGGPCATCEEGYYCSGYSASGAKTPCGDNASSEQGSSDDDDCVCNAGYWLSESAICTKCPVNKYCIGNNQMQDCPGNSTAPSQSTLETDCVCDNGFINE